MFSKKPQAHVESLNDLTSVTFQGSPKRSLKGLKNLDYNLETSDHKLNTFSCRKYIKNNTKEVI